MTIDASGVGWGAHLGPHITVWKDEEMKRSSNWKELKAVFLALKHFEEQLKGHHLQIWSNNVSVVAYVNKQGGTRSGILWSLAKGILHWVEKCVLSLSAVHLKGELNQVDSSLSRRRLREGDWRLNQEVIKTITQRWGVPQVDLFASKENTKV